jgi:probable phosphoglycerate mutase
MTKVWFIRHGESKANAGFATATPSTVSLTDIGWNQAKKVSMAFEQKPTFIVTSNYLRAIQTAQPTIERFPDTPTKTWDIHEFTYLSPEKLGSTSRAERQPLVEIFWAKSDPDYIHGEGAESFSAFMERIKRMIEGLYHPNGVMFSGLITDHLS